MTLEGARTASIGRPRIVRVSHLLIALGVRPGSFVLIENDDPERFRVLPHFSEADVGCAVYRVRADTTLQLVSAGAEPLE